jgi:hypothetical protein
MKDRNDSPGPDLTLAEVIINFGRFLEQDRPRQPKRTKAELKELLLLYLDHLIEQRDGRHGR